MIYLAFDTETKLIGPDQIVPDMICATFATRTDGDIESLGLSTADEEVEQLHSVFSDFLDDKEIHFIGHNMAFDMAVLCKQFPDLIPAVFQAYKGERVHCTRIREKLFNLSTMGSITNTPPPPGQKKGSRISYHLSDLVLKYLGADRTEAKSGDDSWRLNYFELEGIPFEDYPEAASEYALTDALDTLQVFEAQEEAKQGETGPGSFSTEVFHAAADFALLLMSTNGFKVDPVRRSEVEAEIMAELTPDRTVKLIESGVLRPGETARPYKSKKNHEKAAEAICSTIQDVSVRTQYTPDEVAAMERAEVRLTKGVKESINTSVLKDLVERLCKAAGKKPEMTESSETHPEGQISTKAEVLEELIEFDDSGILEEYVHRASLQKILTTELPRMLNKETGEVADRVHPTFDVMKETSRTSSRATDLFPSFNCQNVDPRVRSCYIADEGHVLCSVDYAGVELVADAQMQLELFGTSALADIINAGHDVHAFLGSQLAFHLHPDFQATCKEKGVKTMEEIYHAFMKCKSHPDPVVRKFYGHWRKFAKPTGLGYPGGLGSRTMVTYAKGTFDVIVTEAEASQLKSIWLTTLPEHEQQFAWFTRNCIDPNNIRYSDDGTAEECYAYSSPLGTYRARCTFCQVANGMALQTRTAEGAKLAVFNVIRACYDVSQGSILYGCDPLAFVHDELIVLLPIDEKTHERAYAISKIMVESMQLFIPDVAVKAEPALMLRWDKRAEAVFDEDGILSIWTPEEQES